MQKYDFLAYLCTKFNPMKRVYQVAGHKFSMEMSDGSTCWKSMHSYEPFLVEDKGDCLFSFSLLQELPDVSGKQFVRTDEGESDGLYFELSELNGEWLFVMLQHGQDIPMVYLFTDKAFTKGCVYLNGDAAFPLHTMVLLMYSLATASRGVLMMHASVIVSEGKGYLFLGRSGTGKSTHSQLWIDNIPGSELLNDDNPVLYLDTEGGIRVSGTPWSGKTPCYRNQTVPVGAIVRIRQAKENKIQRLSLPEAYAILFASYSGYHALRQLADGYHTTSERVVTTVPFYVLDCLPNADAALLCHYTVAS